VGAGWALSDERANKRRLYQRFLSLGWRCAAVRCDDVGTDPPQFFVEKLAHIGSCYSGDAGLVVDDRDWTGTRVSSHALSAWGGFLPTGEQPYAYAQAESGNPKGLRGYVGWLGGTTGASGVGGGSAYNPSGLEELREDGYYDGLNVFQGVRAFDPNSNQWTTPDAYSGDVHDPMSQHPYMWNDDNPMVYSDPSGYEPLESETEQVGGLEEIEERAKIVTYGEEEKIAIGRQVAKQSGVPSNWTETVKTKTGVVTYTSPTSKSTQVRIMPGNPTSPYPTSRMPYVRATVHGDSLDKNGKVVPAASSASHIPIGEFNFQQVMPQGPGNPKTSGPPQ
jgi:hypothetical protein